MSIVYCTPNPILLIKILKPKPTVPIGQLFRAYDLDESGLLSRERGSIQPGDVTNGLGKSFFSACGFDIGWYNKVVEGCVRNDVW